MTQQYIGEYFSKEYVFRNVLMMGDEDIKDIKKQIADEQTAGEIPDPEAEAEADRHKHKRRKHRLLQHQYK